MKGILEAVRGLMKEWQDQLAPSGVEVVLGGSLVSGLFILDEETRVIDVDVRFLVEDPADEALRHQVEAVTGLTFRKVITVADWPRGESLGVMVEGTRRIPGASLPLDIEGCIRNRAYVGWARFYQTVLSEDELAEFRRQKRALRGDKKAYKALKSAVRAEVERRCLQRGLVSA